MNTVVSLAEIKTLVRDIQALLSGSIAEEDVPDIIGMARQHDEFVVAVCERAEEVANLLDRGHNDEAIQLADQQPALTEVCMTLDFPELANWSSVLADLAITPVAELPHETIAQLEDAYSVNADSKKLLQRFRLLSLARAPLSKRIAILRRLSAKDSKNGQWAEGIQTYETHRLKSIQRDLKVARERGDLNAVAGIDKEVNAAEWLVSVPDSLRRDARAAHRKLREADARKRLAPLAEELSSAYAEFSVPKATALLARFRGLQDIANLPHDHDVMDVAGPAIDWIEGELQQQQAKAAREQAIVNLRVGLDSNAPLQELESYYYAATEHGEAVPQVLETRLANRIAADETAAKRKRLITISSSVAALCLAVAGVVWLVSSMTFNERVRKNVEQITQLLRDAEASGNTGPVESRFDDLQTDDPAVLKIPDVAALQKQLEALQAKEDGRLRSFNTLLDTVRQVASTPTWSTLPSGQQALSDAEKLIKNSNERAAMLDAKKAINIATATLQEQTDAAFSEELKAVDAAMAKVDSADPESFDKPIEQLQAAMQLPHVSAEVLSQAKARMSKLTLERKASEKRRSVAEGLQMVSRKAVSAKEFEAALKEYVRKQGTIGRGQEMEDVIKFESALWRSVSRWNSFRTQIPSELNSLKPDEAVALRKRITDFSNDAFLGGSQLKATAAVLDSIAKRSTSILGAEEKIRAMFDGPFVDQVYVVKLETGWYYCSEAPKQQLSKVRFKYYENGFAPKAAASKSVDDKKILNADFRPQSPPVFWLSGQSRLRGKIQSAASEKDLPFEEKIQKCMSLLLAADDIDPIFHLLLVENMMTLGRMGSHFIETESRQVTRGVSAIPVSRSADWLKPGNQLKPDRSRAQRQLGEFKSKIRESLAAAIKARDAWLAEPQAGPLQMAGWMHRDRGGNWVVSLNSMSNGGSGADLWVIHVDRQSGKPALTKVGRIEAGKPPTLRSGYSAGKEGRPVFVRLSE